VRIRYADSINSNRVANRCAFGRCAQHTPKRSDGCNFGTSRRWIRAANQQLDGANPAFRCGHHVSASIWATEPRTDHSLHRLNTLVVGRVVAVPGDSVEVRGGQLILNGQPVAEAYVSEPMHYTVAARRLEAGQYYVLGDNRNNAADSHLTGPITEDQIIGLVS
jgi:hypothetical protein